MTTFLHRRLINFGFLLVASAAAVSLTLLYEPSLRDASFFTGWLLLSGMVILLAYNLRKKLPFLPLIKSALWLQIHVYGGCLVALVFFLHTSFALPTGILDSILWTVMVAILISGVAGIVITRLLPARILHHGERIIFERIPGFRAELAREVEDLATKSVTVTASSSINRLYRDTLLPYFSKPQNFWNHICQSQAPRIRMEREIRFLQTYQDNEGKKILAQIQERVAAADNLDYQYAMQLLLKRWLFIHIPLSFAIVPLVICHVLLAYAFAGESF